MRRRALRHLHDRFRQLARFRIEQKGPDGRCADVEREHGGAGVEHRAKAYRGEASHGRAAAARADLARANGFRVTTFEGNARRA